MENSPSPPTRKTFSALELHALKIRTRLEKFICEAEPKLIGKETKRLQRGVGNTTTDSLAAVTAAAEQA
jgi:hypothetical protein